MKSMDRQIGSRQSHPSTAALMIAAALMSAHDARAAVTTLLDLENSPSMGYTFYSYTFQAQYPATFLTFEFRQDPAYWNLDDVSFTASSAPGVQLLLNGGFENGSYGGQATPNSWTLIGQAGLAAGGRVSSGCAHSGAYCYRDGAVGGVDGLYQSIVTTVGSSYTLSFWLSGDGGGPAQAVVQVGTSLNSGGVLTPAPPTVSATDIVSAGSPHLAVGLVNSILNPVFDGGTLQLDSSGPSFTQNFTVNGTNGAIDTAGLTSTMSGVLSGPGGLEFKNTLSGGSVTLSGVNTYAGHTTIDTGTTVALQGNGSIAASNGVTDNGNFDVSGAVAGISIATLSGSGTAVLGANTLSLTNAADTFAGAISGSGGLTVAAGTETLTGVNTYTGRTTINNGAAVALQGSGSVASSGVTDNGAFSISATTAGVSVSTLSGGGAVALGANTLSLTNAADTFSGAINGTGGVTVAAGTEALSGINGYSGRTTINTGATVALQGNGAIASSGVTDNGTFTVSGAAASTSITTLSGSGAVALGANTLSLTNAADTFAGSISGTGGITANAGTETLTGINTYSGSTMVNNGAAILLQGSGSVAPSNVVDNGTFSISGLSAGASITSLAGAGSVSLGANNLSLTNAAGTFSGAVNGTGGVTVAAGTESLTGINTYTGQSAISTGAILALQGSGSIASSSVVADNGSLDISATTIGASIASLNGAGTVALGSRKLTLTSAADTFAGVIGGSGDVVVAGGTETLSGTNTYTGHTTISTGGDLVLQNNGGVAVSNGVTDNGRFDVSGSAAGPSVTSLAGIGTVILGANTLSLTGAADTFAGAVTGTGGIAVAAGSETLAGMNTYSGATTIANGGTLALAGNGSVAASSVIANNGTLDVSATTGASVQSLSGSGGVALGANTLTLANAADNFAGVIGGSGGLTLAAGTETLSGANTYTGATTVALGATLALTGAGSIAASSSAGVNGTLDLSGLAADTSLQRLAGTGNVALGVNSLTLSNAADNFGGVINGSGGLTIASGQEALSGINTYTGATAVAAGSTLSITGAGSIANSSNVAADGVLDVSAASNGASLQSLSGAGSVALGNNLLTLSDAAGTFAGTISGLGSLTLAGGVETLGGTNGYAGTTTIAQGAGLVITTGDAIASSSAVVDNGSLDLSGATGGASVHRLAGAGTVALGATTLTISNANDSFDGTLNGTGGLTVAAGAESLSGTNTYTGTTTIGGLATIALVGAGSIATSIRVVDAGLVDISRTTGPADTTLQSLAGGGAVSLGARGLTLANAADTFAGAITGSGTLNVGAGTETLTGTNTYTGVTSVASGATLALAGNGTIANSSSVLANGTVDITATNTGAAIGSLAGSGQVTLGTQSLMITHAADTFAGTIGGAGALTVTGGTQALTGSNTYTGGTTVSNGARLAVNSDAALGDTSGGVTLNNGTLQTTAPITTARNFVLSGDNGIATDPGAAFTQTGQISGDGHVTKTGDGTLTLAGDNRNWGAAGNTALGGLTVDAGLVEIIAPYALGYGLITINGGAVATTVDILTGQTIQVASDVVLNVDAGTTTQLTGIVQSTGSGGCFQKVGTGTLNIEGSATLSNGTCIEAGKLSANGTLISNVSVTPNAILRGTGTISGPVTVQGTLAPGNSPGTLTVAGNVTMMTGSIYQEDINGTGTGSGPGNYSRLLVTGANNKFIASGATLVPNITGITGTATYVPYAPQFGDSYRIITAAGGIVGQFAALTQPTGLAAGTRLTAFYDMGGSNSIDLRVMPLSYSTYLQSQYLNRNAQSAGAALDGLVSADLSGAASASQEDLIYAISGLDKAQLRAASTALAGEVHGELAAVAPLAGQWLQSAVVRQFQSSGGDAHDAAHVESGDALWFDAGGNHADWSSDSAASSFTTNRWQLATGFDLYIGDAARLGIGYTHSESNVSSNIAAGDIEQNLGFVYGQYTLPVANIDALAAYGSSTWDTHRGDPLGTAGTLSSHADGKTSLASLGARFPLTVKSFTLEPYARVLWEKVTREAFAENASIDAIDAPEYSSNGVRLSAGIGAGSTARVALSAPFTYHFDIGVAHDSNAIARPATPAEIAGQPMSIVTPNIGRFAAVADINATARFRSRGYVFLNLSTESRRGESADYGGDLGVRWAF